MKKIKKFKKAAKKPFIIAFNDKIDKKVDEALMMDTTNFPSATIQEGCKLVVSGTKAFKISLG